MALGKGKGYWLNKTSCWEMRGCEMKPGGGENCPAYRNQIYPCWAIKGTICKGPSGEDISVCSICKVYMEYGKGEKIELK